MEEDTAEVVERLRVDIPTIARRYEVTRWAVKKWQRRYDDFPDPAGRVSGRPWWYWSDVHAWAQARGLPKK